MCSRWEGFGTGICVVGVEATDQASIESDLSEEVGNGKLTFIKFKDGRAIVRLCDGIVKFDCVQFFIPSYCNACKSLNL